MTSSTAPSLQWFTPEKARRTLPLVGAILADIVDMRESIRSRQERVDEMLLARGDDGNGPYQDELQAMRRSLDEDRRRIDQFVSELSAIGILTVEGESSEVEFPTWVTDRAARLCWRLGEDDLTGWRELEDSLIERRSLEGVEFGESPIIDLLDE